MSCGDNQNGERGFSKTTQFYPPNVISGLENIIDVAAGAYYSIALHSKIK